MGGVEEIFFSSSRIVAWCAGEISRRPCFKVVSAGRSTEIVYLYVYLGATRGIPSAGRGWP